MSGMLPGVEVARRRRLGHQRGGWSDSPATVAYGSVRRASLCSNSRSLHDGHHSSASASSSSSSSVYEDDGKLGGAAREAKERLDERLRAPTRKGSATRRQNPINGETLRSSGVDRTEREQVGTSLKKGGSKRFLNWTGLINWKDMEQEDCAVCLERFKAGETLMHLPCAHRFHSGCLVPWLESNAHCPCCRTMVPS